MSSREMLQPSGRRPFAVMAQGPGPERAARPIAGGPGLGAVTNASYAVWDGTQEMCGRLRAGPPGNAGLGAGWPHDRRGRLRRASLPAPGGEVPRRGDGHPVPDLPPVPAYARNLRLRGRARALRRPGEAGGRTGRDGRRIWG